MSDALTRYKAGAERDALARYRQVAPGDDLGALRRYIAAGFGNYFTRQGRLAQEGLAAADQGSMAVKGGDLSGLGGMILGPLGYLSSPVTALLPRRAHEKWVIEPYDRAQSSGANIPPELAAQLGT